MTGLNATTAGAPVGSMQRKLSAGKFRVVIRPIGDAPNQSEGGALRLVRLGELQRVRVAAHQPLDPRSDSAIPLGLARELSDLSVAKVAQVRKLFEEAGRPLPATDLDNWEAEFPGWDEKAEPVEAPVTRMLLVDLPDDLLALILASRRGRARIWHAEQAKWSRPITKGHALARAGACCHVFATCARVAAKIVAGRHGWCLLPVAGSTPMQHLSKLEHDTKLVRSILCQMNERARPLPNVMLWVEEVPLGFNGALSIDGRCSVCDAQGRALSIDGQVRWQHTLELGKLLILLPMRVGSDDPERDMKVAEFVEQLSRLMTQPNTQLDASWLAACVFPLVELHMAIENRGNRPFGRHQYTRARLVTLLGFLEPSVLRSHPETFEWLRTTMKMCRFRHPTDLWAHKPNETVWSVGLAAWNERCEAQGLGEGCDPETRAAKLEAILHCGVRGCFVRLSALGTPVDHEWLSRVGWEVFPAVYH